MKQWELGTITFVIIKLKNDNLMWGAIEISPILRYNQFDTNQKSFFNQIRHFR